MTTERKPKMALNKLKVCLIGAGPSGMSVMFHLNRLAQQGVQVPEIKCYEKQSNWGGLWNYSWRTGTDALGEPVHGSMYRYLWSNGPKEALEFPDYTFEQHYGKAIPSFPPREVLFDYLQGRWKQSDLKKWITFNRVVKNVEYNEHEDNFKVVVKNCSEDRVMAPETFDMIFVASGHYSVPNVPAFPGIEKFPGRVCHAHDFRDACEFSGKRLLLIGSSYSAEDIALQCLKYGAKSIICTWRSKPMGFNWPESITERPLLLEMDGKNAHFKDGSSAEVDAIILCTGYKHSYPFLREDLRLQCGNELFTPNLYKGIVWTKGGNNKLLYVSSQDNFYTYTMFDAQALWAVKLIQGEMSLPPLEQMIKEWKIWKAKESLVTDWHTGIDYQTEYVKDICKDLGTDYPHDLDVAEMFHTWENHKQEDVKTYRDQSFKSKFTGVQSPIHHSTFMSALDDSLETFMYQTKDKSAEQMALRDIVNFSDLSMKN